jgi:putative membrane protein
MTGLIQVLGVVFGVLLIAVGIAESFFIRDQRLHRFFLMDAQETVTETVRLWTFNLGFYNVIWGIGAIVGAFMLAGAESASGRTVLLFTCVAHVILGIILFLSERRLWASAIAEASLPLVMTVLLLV